MQPRRQTRLPLVRVAHAPEVIDERAPRAIHDQGPLEASKRRRVVRAHGQDSLPGRARLLRVASGRVDEARSLREELPAGVVGDRFLQLGVDVRQELPLAPALASLPPLDRVARRVRARGDRSGRMLCGVRGVAEHLVDQCALKVRARPRDGLLGPGKPLHQRTIEDVEARDRRVVDGRRLRAGALLDGFDRRVHPRHLLAVVVPDADPVRVHRLVVDELLPRCRRGPVEQLCGDRLHPRLVHGYAGGLHERVERVTELGSRLEALVGIFRQCARQSSRERGRIVGNERRRVGHLGVADAPHRLDVRVAAEETAIERHLPERHAQGEDIRPAIGRLAEHLLGRQVRELALDDADGRLRDPVAGLGETEVDELRHPLVRHEDVRRAHIAMDHVERLALIVAELVRVVQGVGDPGAEPRELRVRKALLAGMRPLPQLEERPPAEDLHREEVALAVVSEAVDGDDVRVRQARRDARLVEEHRDELLVSPVLGADHLEGGEAVRRLRRAAEPDARHAPFRDGRKNRVLPEPLERQARLRRPGHREDPTPDVQSPKNGVASGVRECTGVPAREMCARVVGGLREVEDRAGRIRGAPDALVGEQELLQLLAIAGIGRPHAYWLPKPCGSGLAYE